MTLVIRIREVGSWIGNEEHGSKVLGWKFEKRSFLRPESGGI